jgi:hypothetical protein
MATAVCDRAYLARMIVFKESTTAPLLTLEYVMVLNNHVWCAMHKAPI